MRLVALPVRRRNSDTQGQRRWSAQGLLDPFTELENLWSEMGRLLDWVPSPGGDHRAWMPLAEQHETEDAYVVRAELPGIPPQKVSVEIDDEQLIVSGELDETDQSRANVLSRRTGRFEYRSSVPRGVDPEAVTADLRDGVLTVRIPKTGQTKRRRISITDGGAEQGGGNVRTVQGTATAAEDTEGA
jgi:HSP20 family protein